jgi:hypothetical protein
MAAISDYLEAKLLDHTFRNTAYTPPATVYLALYTANPTDAGGGTEVTGGSYARQAVTFGAAASPGGTVANSALVTFTNMPACTVTGCAVMDAATAGNLLMHGPPVANRTVSAADALTVAIGDLVLTLA